MRFKKDRLKVTVLGVYSSIHDTEYTGDDYFVTQKRDALNFTLEGIIGDRHFGYTAVSGGRFKTLYQKGSLVRNSRQWLAMSPQEVQTIAKNLGIEGTLTPELLGINLLLEGIEKLSGLPPMTYIVFSQYSDFQPQRPDDVTLVVYAQALPCTTAGKALVKPLDDTSLKTNFPKAAFELRGTTGWVEHGGIIRPGYTGWVLTPTGYD